MLNTFFQGGEKFCRGGFALPAPPWLGACWWTASYFTGPVVLSLIRVHTLKKFGHCKPQLCRGITPFPRFFLYRGMHVSPPWLFRTKKHSRMRCYFSSLQYNRFMGVYGQFNKRCEVKQHRVSNLRRFSPVMGDKMKELPHELKKVNAVMPESECSLVSKTRGFKHCKALNFCISLSFELHTCSWIVVNDLKCDLPYP